MKRQSETHVSLEIKLNQTWGVRMELIASKYLSKY